MTLHWEESEQDKMVINELYSKMVDEYYMGVESSGDLMIMLDCKYFPISNNTDILSYSITAGNNMGHAYIIVHLTNERTQEKRQIMIVVCPFRIRARSVVDLNLMRLVRLHEAFSNPKNTDNNVEPPRSMILSKWIAYPVNNSETFGTEVAKHLDPNGHKALMGQPDEVAKQVDQSKDRPMVVEFIIDRLILRPFINALNIMTMSWLTLATTDVVINDHKIDACKHCVKYIPKLGITTIGKDIEIIKRLYKEFPLHVCTMGMGYCSTRLTQNFLEKRCLVA